MPIEIPGKPASNIRVIDNSAAASRTRSPDIDAQHGSTRPVADTVSLTDTAAHLRRLENKLAALPVVDIPRTESIKQALADGRYVVDPTRVADKLLRFESMLYHRAA